MRTCRICHSDELERFLSLGSQPHCNSFLTDDQLHEREPHYPLDVYFCARCALVQLGYAVPRERMFLDHPYVSGTTETLRSHFGCLARRIAERYELDPASLVVDVGSNDGTWLREFKEVGVKTLGVEPAPHIAKLAEEQGIETEIAFFGEDVARDIARRRGSADVITAAGVFFHIDDLYDFVAGVDALLAPDGVFVVQAMYLRDIVERTAFDSIYHEHLEYYSLWPLVVLFERFGMEIVDVERVDIHGGSFVLDVRRSGVAQPSRAVADLLDAEEAAGLYDVAVYRDFARRAEGVRDELVALLRSLKENGSKLAAYGAPARGNTLLNFCGIGPGVLDYAAEKNPLKFGLYTPGTHIPVVPEHTVAPPDYFLLLAWNFARELLAKERAYRARGGRFVIPLPEPAVT